jgi:GNAT superfamily N-acetyltransferase
MTQELTLTIRPTTAADLAAVDALMAASFPRLLKPDYPPSVLVTALPLIARANPVLLRSGRYFLAEDGDGRVLAAGGWSPAPPGGGAGREGIGHIRHVATHPDATRRGIATALLQRVLCDALGAGITRMEVQSTRTALPFYAKIGFARRRAVTVPLAPGIDLPVVEMARAL